MISNNVKIKTQLYQTGKWLIPLFLGILYGFYAQRLELGYLDALFRDIKIVSTPKEFSSPGIVAINTSPLKPYGQTSMSAKSLKQVIEQVIATNPRNILITLSTNEFNDATAEYKELKNLINKTDNIYLYSWFGEDPKESLAGQDDFQNNPRNFTHKITVDKNLSPFDNRLRRLVLSMDGKDLDTEFKMLLGAFSIETKHLQDYVGSFKLLESEQVFIRFYNPERFPIIAPNEITSTKLTNKTVIISSHDAFSSKLSTYPLERFLPESQRNTNTYLPQHSYLMTIYQNILKSEYIHSPSVLFNSIWIGAWTTISLFFIFNLTPLPYFYTSLALPLIIFILNYVIFFTTQYDYDLSRIMTGILLINYVGLPVIFLRYIRKTDRIKTENEKRQERDRIKSRFVVRVAQADLSLKVAAQVSHDIRSPLMALQIVSSIIKDQISADAKELLLSSTERIKSIANDLLTRYRGDHDSSTEDDSTELKSAVEELVNTFKTLHKDIEITTDIPADIILSMPYFSFQRCLTNLLTNAAEALDKTTHAKIRIYAKKIDLHYIIDIQDNGPGIANEIKNRLFSERATFGKTGGTGIGLNQVKNELADFAGKISLQESTQGAHFQISFPADLSQIPLKVSPTIIILEGSSDLTNFISQNQLAGIALKSFSQISELKCYLSDPKVDRTQITLVTDLFFPNQEETSLDLLESYQGFFKIIICTPLVEHKDIQDIATHYQALLTKKSFVKRMHFELASTFRKAI